MSSNNQEQQQQQQQQQPQFPIPLSYVSFVITILSFGITILNLVALYANFVATIRNAPAEIRDTLGNLRQQMCEEREALKRQTRVVRAKNTTHRARSRRRGHGHGHGRDSYDGNPVGARAGMIDPDYSEQTLSLHYITLRDLWRRFKALERPFLVASGSRAEAIRNGEPWGEEDFGDEKVRMDVERRGEAESTADWRDLYRCDFTHRFIWWQSKDDVLKLGDAVSRVMLMRMEREVTQTRMMVKKVFDAHSGPSPNYPTQQDADARGGTVSVRRDWDARDAGGGADRRRRRSTDEWTRRRYYRVDNAD